MLPKNTLHTDRILQLADVIEQQPDTSVEAPSGFSMSDVRHYCGTPCCIAGWALAAAGDTGPESMDLGNYVDVFTRAGNYLGLVGEQDMDLFAPAYTVALLGDENHITARHAAAVLRHLAETGEIDWRIGRAFLSETANG